MERTVCYICYIFLGTAIYERDHFHSTSFLSFLIQVQYIKHRPFRIYRIDSCHIFLFLMEWSKLPLTEGLFSRLLTVFDKLRAFHFLQNVLQSYRFYVRDFPSLFQNWCLIQEWQILSVSTNTTQSYHPKVNPSLNALQTCRLSAGCLNPAGNICFVSQYYMDFSASFLYQSLHWYVPDYRLSHSVDVGEFIWACSVELIWHHYSHGHCLN